MLVAAGAQWRLLKKIKYDAGNPKPMLFDNLEGWGGEGCGRVVQEGGSTCMPVADSCWCMAKAKKYCEVIILQLNNFFRE